MPSACVHANVLALVRVQACACVGRCRALNGDGNQRDFHVTRANRVVDSPSAATLQAGSSRIQPIDSDHHRGAYRSRASPKPPALAEAEAETPASRDVAVIMENMRLLHEKLEALDFSRLKAVRVPERPPLAASATRMHAAWSVLHLSWE